MNAEKTLFAQVMAFVPWTSFARIVICYSGDARVSTLQCTEHFRTMAYAQLTWRESLRDTEATFSANATKLYGMDLRCSSPTLTYISDGKMDDVNLLNISPLEARAFYIMDRSYLDFSRLHARHEVGAFFVTRAKSNFNARQVYSAKVKKATGAMCSQSVALNGFKAAKNYPEQSRWARFTDPKGKTLIFSINNKMLLAPVITQLYKNCWQVELFFK